MAPILETLPLKKSQDSTVPRRLIYLDQNVVSNIAKARIGRRLPTPLAEATAALYASIRDSVLTREDAVCVESTFHRTESSGLVVMANEARANDAERLFHEISEFVTYYSFNLQLSSCSELREVQTVTAVARQLGWEADEDRIHNWQVALSRDPHEPHEVAGRVFEDGGYRFVIGAEWRPQTIEESPWAENVTRMRANDEFPNFDETMERAKREQRASAVKDNEWWSWAGRWSALDEMPRHAVDEFIQSEAFFDIPLLYASRHLYAHVLSERTRAFKDSDPNDIDILSSAIPYCDLVVTDRYMAEVAIQRGLDAAFNTTILPATPEGLQQAAEFLNQQSATLAS